MGGKRREGPYGPDYWKQAFSEAGSAFVAADLEARRALYEAVLHYHSFTCAMTGAAFAATEGIHPDLQVSAIRPLAAGGALDVSNFIALSADADVAFQQGHLSVGPDHRLLADLSRIDPELLERLNPDGRLRLPADKRAWPSEDSLAFHREHIFAREGRG